MTPTSAPHPAQAAQPAEPIRPVSLVDWDYWNTVWSAGRGLLSRGNSADGYPRPLTPLTQDLVLTFKNAGAHLFLERTLRVQRRGGLRPPFWLALCSAT